MGKPKNLAIYYLNQLLRHNLKGTVEQNPQVKKTGEAYIVAAIHTLI